MLHHQMPASQSMVVMRFPCEILQVKLDQLDTEIWAWDLFERSDLDLDLFERSDLDFDLFELDALQFEVNILMNLLRTSASRTQ